MTYTVCVSKIIKFIKVEITNVIYHWGEDWQLLCWIQELSFISHSIRIRIRTVCSWHWKPSSVQFNFLVMALKQLSGNMVELSTFLTWEKVVIRYKTLSLPNNGKSYLVQSLCCTQKWYCESLERKCKTECTGFHIGNKCGNQTPGMDFFWVFFVTGMKFKNCLISVWNGSSQLQLLYNVFCYIIWYSLTMIPPKVICHLWGQAHNIAVELERAKPNNEKAVSKKALPSTLNQPRIDHVCDKNMSEGYIKLFCTAHTLTIEPTLPLSRFTTLVKMQRENGVRLI